MRSSPTLHPLILQPCTGAKAPSLPDPAAHHCTPSYSLCCTSCVSTAPTPGFPLPGAPPACEPAAARARAVQGAACPASADFGPRIIQSVKLWRQQGPRENLALRTAGQQCENGKRRRAGGVPGGAWRLVRRVHDLNLKACSQMHPPVACTELIREGLSTCRAAAQHPQQRGPAGGKRGPPRLYARQIATGLGLGGSSRDGWVEPLPQA